MVPMRASFFGKGTQKVRCSDILGTLIVGSLVIFFLTISGSVNERPALAAPESSNPLSGDSDAIAVGQTLYRYGQFHQGEQTAVLLFSKSSCLPRSLDVT